ncbi:MAG: hypothetical protein IPJ97_10005 [Proteobacteria bacterium]|nr:hypothetical protein [Pseudomonadota bacterium]
MILLGALAQHHAAYSELRRLAAALADATGAQLGSCPRAATRSARPWRASAASRGRRSAVTAPGLNAVEMLAARLKAYVLVGGIESADLVPSSAVDASLRGADCVVAITPYASARCWPTPT